MASATGIPEQNHPTMESGEEEPLLGRPGDASQQEGKGLQFNLVIGKRTFVHHKRSSKPQFRLLPTFYLLIPLPARHRSRGTSRNMDCKPTDSVPLVPH